MISIYLKEHEKGVCEINIASDCRIIETIHTDKSNHNQKIQELIDRYGNIPVIQVA